MNSIFIEYTFNITDPLQSDIDLMFIMSPFNLLASIYKENKANTLEEELIGEVLVGFIEELQNKYTINKVSVQ